MTVAADAPPEQHCLVTREDAFPFVTWKVGVHLFAFELDLIAGTSNVELVLTEIDTRTERRRRITALVTPEIAAQLKEALDG